MGGIERNDSNMWEAVGDGAGYGCCCTMLGRGAVSEGRQLTGSIAKNFTKEPSSVVTYVGGSARFDCSIKAIPPATIIWQRDNEQLTVDDHRFVQLLSGALQIHNVSGNDEGSYRCMAAQNFNHLPDEVTNIKWKWSQQARLNVLPRPGSGMELQLLAAPNNTTAMAGETVILECLANGIPAPGIHWRRRGDHRALSEDRHQMFGGGNLMIVNVRPEDAGVYQCVLVQGLLKQHHEATLNILTYPVMITDPESNDWPIVRTVSLFCEVEGNPRPNIMWYFNGVPIHKLERDSLKYELIDDNTRLIVYTIRLENSGYYQCIAENTIGQVFAIARIGVFAHRRPPPPEKVTLTPISSSMLQMEWTQESDKPVLAFLITHRIRDEGSLHEEQETVGGVERSYNLTDLLPYTTYVVTIRTFSRKGSSTRKTVEERTLEGVPQAVPTFQVSSPSGETMLVVWEELAAKDRGGEITQYQLQYRPTSTPSAITTMTTDQPHQRSYLLTGLKPETTYEVRLAAGTKEGFPDKRGGWSHHTTPRISTDGQPQLRVDVLNSTAVLLHWERLEVGVAPRGGGPHRYLIQAVELRQMGGEAVLLKAVLDPPAPTYILNHLENNTDYEVRVLANQQAVEVTHTFRIAQGLLVPRASKLRSHGVNPTTVRLEWTPSVNTGRIGSYQVCYREAASPADLDHTCVDSDRPYAVVSELKAFTKYQFGVRIMADQRQGAFTTLEVLTSEDKPGPPVNVTYQVLKRGSVRLHWSPPSQPNGLVTSYIIFYHLDSQVPDGLWSNLTKTGQQRIAQVDGLDLQQYFFKLAACTKAGRGHPSKVVMVYPDCVSSAQCGFTDPPEQRAGLTDKQVGIVIGVCIGLACIIVCIIVILCRHKCFRVYSASPAPATVLHSRPHNHHHHPNHGNNNVLVYHGNGHVPSGHGNGHAHAPASTEPALGSMEMTAMERMPMLMRLPENEMSDAKVRERQHCLLDCLFVDNKMERMLMLMRLPENEMSDAKGGGDMIVTPNGVRVNGLVKINGHLPNGHVAPATLDLSATSEERRGLIEAMLAATIGSNPQHQSSTGTLTGHSHSDPPTDPEVDSLCGLDRWDSAEREEGASGPWPSAQGGGVMLAGNVGSPPNGAPLLDHRRGNDLSHDGRHAPFRDKGGGEGEEAGGGGGEWVGGSPPSTTTTTGHNSSSDGGGEKVAGEQQTLTTWRLVFGQTQTLQWGNDDGGQKF
ncbi:hypothetical protein ACOMHN_000731 [Nucella lapillus]